MLTSYYLCLTQSARAIESQCYVLAAAQYGRHNVKRESFGHSLAVDPWGKILADAGGYPFDDPQESAPSKPEEEPTIVTCEIDLDLVDSVRQRLPIDLHRSNASFYF
jgi:predicted amidohydrolase